MLRITQVKIPYDTRNVSAALEKKIRDILRLKKGEPFSFEIKRRSIDARKHPDIFVVYTVDINFDNISLPELKKRFSRTASRDKRISFPMIRVFDPVIKSASSLGDEPRPIVCGFGPAGIFAGYILALNGLSPLILERGERADERTASVQSFWEKGELDLRSNVCFGEGGAGTFSDGKLNTGVKDTFGYGEFVLRTLVEFGAPSEILYDARPHIGTDRLQRIIPAIRERIVSLGGEVRFLSTLTDIGIKDGRLDSVTVNDSERIPASTLILAIGHSARDTYELLLEKKLDMEAKAFSVGFRTEHPQALIDRAMYKRKRDEFLPAAPYRLSYTPKGGRGVYSFCMCPGGYVVNSSTEDGGLCVNGMSYSGRDGANANSAIVVTAGPEDFEGCPGIKKGVLSGVYFQRALEQKAYALGGGKIPQQLFGDFERGVKSTGFGGFSSCTKGAAAFCDMRSLLPGEIEKSFINGMHEFSKSIPGFDGGEVILSGIEGRTSSPVRIIRNDRFMSNIEGIYPCGEGAGYAGGITSAAMDGIKTARAVLFNAGE